MKTSRRLCAAGLCLILASLPILSAIIAEDAPPTYIPPSAGPITLSFESVEQTLYFNGNNRQYIVWPLEMTSDVSAYGTVSWELTRESGDALTMYLTDQTQTACSLRYRDIISAGSVRYTLTCRVGHYAKAVPIRIEVSAATVPDTMLALQQVYNAAAGERIAIPRPDLLPLGTDLPASAFAFELIIPGGPAGGLTRPETSDDMQICVFDLPGYYHGSIWMHNASNISFRHNLLFVITDAAGAVPGSPLSLLPAALEETVYLGGTAEGFRLGRCDLQDARYSLGAPVWTITPEVGDALRAEIGSQTEERCEVILAGMAHEGDAAFSVHCAVGAFSASVPALFHVSAASVPGSMVVSANVYRAAAGETISVSRPELLPAGTALATDAFDFMVAMDPSVLSASLVSKEAGAIGLRFSQPGYYQGKIIMREGNIAFFDDVLFIISGADGAVPGSPLQLDKNLIEATVYLAGNVENAVIAQARLLSGLDRDLWQLPSAYFGEPVWSLSDLSGDAMRLSVQSGPPDECRLIAASLAHTGDVSGTLWCDSGGFSVSIPVLIHVADAAVPLRMETADLYTAMVDEQIPIPCPDLLPEGAVPSENYFTPGLSGDAAFESAASWQATKEGGIALSFSAPGMYTATLSMSHSNIRVTRDVRFNIAPAPVFMLDSVTLSARSIALGGSVTATALAYGAAGDTFYAFRAYRDGRATGIHQGFGPENSFIFTPEEAGLYTIQAAAWDGRSLVSAFSESIAAGNEPALEVQVSGSGFMTGEVIQARANAAGGSGEYSYAFQVFKGAAALEDPAMRQGFSPADTFSFTPALPGLYTIRVTLDDGIIRILRDSSPITVITPLPVVTLTPTPTRTLRPVTVRPLTPVTPKPVTATPRLPEPITPQPVTAPPITLEPVRMATPLAILWPLTVSAQANTAYGATGQTISVKAQASGGTGSYGYSFQVYLNNAAIGSATAFSAKNAFSFTPAKPGDYKVLVKARDGVDKASVYTGNINIK